MGSQEVVTIDCIISPTALTRGSSAPPYLADPCPRPDVNRSYSSRRLALVRGVSQNRAVSSLLHHFSSSRLVRSISSPLSARNLVSEVFSSFGIVSVVETYYCQICLEHQPKTSGFVLTACGHEFCRDCLNRYLTSKISDATVFHLQCPFLPNEALAGADTGCLMDIIEHDIRILVEPSVFDKFERFKLMKTDQTYRECPTCSCAVTGGSQRRPQLTCENCGLVFCFLHSNAHPGQTCRQYERARRAEEKMAAAAVAACSRRCPGCRTPIMRDGGCNHMTCSNCSANFCWLCGRDLGIDADAFPTHYAWWNVCGCPGLQMREGCLASQHRICAQISMMGYRLVIPVLIIAMGFGTFFLGVVLVIVSTALSLVCSLILYPMLSCKYCCYDRDEDDYERTREMLRWPCLVLFIPCVCFCACCNDDDD